MYMEYRVELGINNMEKVQKSPHSGKNSITYACTCNAQFSNFGQFLYFSYNLLNSYPI